MSIPFINNHKQNDNSPAYSDNSEPPIRQSEPLKSGGFLGG
ncbi:MAG: hypothetical protein Q8K64_15395 [Sediminibacterium sp.]|nr:hypothetical protein [Sediminibacterium sp.]